jgi:hypothetical protein
VDLCHSPEKMEKFQIVETYFEEAHVDNALSTVNNLLIILQYALSLKSLGHNEGSLQKDLQKFHI